MDFTPSDDQQVFLTMLDRIADAPGTAWAPDPDWRRYQWSNELDATLDENGFLGAAAEPGLGPVTAAAMIYRLAQLPVLVEAAASALPRALFASSLPRPVAIVVSAHPVPGSTRELVAADIKAPDEAIPFLPVARSAIRIDADGVRIATLAADGAPPVESLFAYPMGSFAETPDWRDLDVDPEAVLDTWRVALAAELAGVLQGGLGAVLEHVRERRQFGRPLGSFQAVQHRLAEAATRIEGCYWMTLRAAQSGATTDAAQALGWMQASAGKIVYDLHQFMGAMGLTLEHPLHRWTYRARYLRASLGGASANLGLASERKWSAA